LCSLHVVSPFPGIAGNNYAALETRAGIFAELLTCCHQILAFHSGSLLYPAPPLAAIDTCHCHFLVLLVDFSWDVVDLLAVFRWLLLLAPKSLLALAVVFAVGVCQWMAISSINMHPPLSLVAPQYPLPRTRTSPAFFSP
jgi:hypothetical protein